MVLRHVAVLWLGLVAPACGAGGSGETGGAPARDSGPKKLECVGGIGLVGYGWACAIRPSATGRGISDAFGLHVVAYPGKVTPETPVYIHLVGTGGIPAGPEGAYTNSGILIDGTTAGYVVINLAYPNVEPLRRMCGDDGDCYERVRWQIISGERPPAPWTDRSRVVPPEDIDSRLRALVDALAASGRELPSALRPIDWSRLRVGGHSQGAGHAALIARRRAVARVCMLAGPTDTSAGLVPASWIGGSWATPLADRRLVIHRGDELYPGVHANATHMGLVPDVQLRVLEEPTADPHGCPVGERGGHAQEARRWACFD